MYAIEDINSTKRAEKRTYVLPNGLGSYFNLAGRRAPWEDTLANEVGRSVLYQVELKTTYEHIRYFLQQPIRF